MRRLVSIVFYALMIASPVSAELPTPTAQEIDSFRQSDGILPALVAEEPLLSWDRALKVELAGGTAEAAADRLAGRYGIPSSAVRELVTLWLASQTDAGSGYARIAPENRGRLDAELRTRFAALLVKLGRTPLLLQVAAAGLRGGFAEDRCTSDGFDTLIRGSTDPVGEGWLLARTANCPVWYQRFAELNPDHRTAALLALAFAEDADRANRLALLQYLTSASVASHFAAPDRVALMARLRADYMSALLQAGLVDAALSFDSGLDAATRQRMLDILPTRQMHVDGLTLGIPETLSDVSDPDLSNDGVTREPAHRANEFLQAQLGAAYLVAGRTSAARDQFKLLNHAGDVAAAMACANQAEAVIPAGNPAPRCPSLGREGWRLVLLDHGINHERDDPYPIAEGLIGGSGAETTGVWAELVCHILNEPKYAGVCSRLREETTQSSVSSTLSDAPSNAFAAALNVIQPSELASRSAATPTPRINEPQRATQSPAPTPFVETAIPPAFRGPGLPQGWDSKWAPLPKGFEPVRIGRDRNRIAVISVSQNYDPTGEISRGGYWVHLSGNRGQSWGKPLYTGLAEFYPYVVLPQAALPLFDGEALRVAVEVKELDPESITYPPVGLRIKRQAQNLYLTIPLATLTRDGDSDGFTDIAAKHLLLDSPIRGTPMLIRSNADGTCGGAESDVQRALADFLAKLFGSQTGAVVEPVDRRPDAPLEGDTQSAPNSADRPIFIEGDPSDLACLRTGRPTIIYRPADVARMRQMVPDFHAVTLGAVVYNRAHDRGVFSFSTGWSGGTVRLRRTAAGWTLEPLSRWVT